MAPQRSTNRNHTTTSNNPSGPVTRPQRHCQSCNTPKAVNHFPSSRRVSQHGHTADVCMACFKYHVDSSIESSTRGLIICPLCPQPLSYQEVRLLASHENFNQYQTIILNTAFANNADFLCCPSTTCHSGQIHAGDLAQGTAQPYWKCVACDYEYCVYCQVKWHEGLTCQAHQPSVQKKAQDELDKKLEDMLSDGRG